ncbi:AMP-binding enzyme [Streptomyces aurantiogriseus]|uniref:AMP-binding enzyme C-terminal domain-containing protein n=1 Tax=Streptomyces aurantiogriseus TaxID=66870 RepID=A0A918KZ03_9ACTN|nr:hypothetical protein [Streptomyces aurantiogriseus]GGR52695.1 hypothetical protein GCM10010251_82280 [Streptomyces aurantiogriseus]
MIGVPDEHYGEEVAALIAARPGSEPGAAEVSSWVRERLSAYKIPRIVRFVDALPKGPTGKILKRSSTVPLSPATRRPATVPPAATERPALRVRDGDVGFKYSSLDGHYCARGDRRREGTAHGAPLAPS